MKIRYVLSASNCSGSSVGGKDTYTRIERYLLAANIRKLLTGKLEQYIYSRSLFTPRTILDQYNRPALEHYIYTSNFSQLANQTEWSENNI